MYELRHEPLASRREFAARVVLNVALAVGVAGVSLVVGMVGYHGFEGLPWIDAFVNAAMILGGMGPVDPLHTDGGKIFAGLYALYSGLALLTMMAILLAPLAHRFLHRFHLEGAHKARPASGGAPRA
jgi:hypothetical protein